MTPTIEHLIILGLKIYSIGLILDMLSHYIKYGKHEKIADYAGILWYISLASWFV